MSYGPRFDDALAFAAEKHRAQTRKSTGVPYITHLLAVAASVGEHHGSEAQVVAALLHDIIEDQGVTRDELAARFGVEAADIVWACTDADVRPKPPWRQRKERHIAHLRTADPRVKLVVACDKLHNVRCVVRDHRTLGPAVWNSFSTHRDGTLWYYRAITEALAEGWDHAVLDELRETVARLEELP